MFINPRKRKNDALPASFQPNGFFTAYLLSQFHLFFFALASVVLIPVSGVLIRQPLMIVWWVVVCGVSVLTLTSILHLWEGERRGFHGLILSQTLFFLFFLGYSTFVNPETFTYLVILLINMMLLMLFVYPKRHLLW